MPSVLPELWQPFYTLVFDLGASVHRDTDAHRAAAHLEAAAATHLK